jgi:hypothetical protein
MQTIEKQGPLICDAPQLVHPLGVVDQASGLAGSFTALFTRVDRMSSFSKESKVPP